MKNRKPPGSGLPPGVDSRNISATGSSIKTRDPETGQELEVRRVRIFDGPWPSPEYLREIAVIEPEAPAQIFEAFKDERKHRHKQQTDAQWIPFYNAVSMRIAALGFTGFCTFLAYQAILAKMEIGVVVFGGAALINGVRAFIVQKEATNPADAGKQAQNPSNKGKAKRQN